MLIVSISVVSCQFLLLHFLPSNRPYQANSVTYQFPIRRKYRGHKHFHRIVGRKSLPPTYSNGVFGDGFHRFLQPWKYTNIPINVILADFFYCPFKFWDETGWGCVLQYRCVCSCVKHWGNYASTCVTELTNWLKYLMKRWLPWDNGGKSWRQTEMFHLKISSSDPYQPTFKCIS